MYCPHTAVDAAPGGINDWLADACLNDNTTVNQANKGAHDTESSFSIVEKSREVLQPVANPLPEGLDASITGYGRKVALGASVPVGKILANLKTSLGISFVNIAFQQPDTLDHVLTKKVSSFAVCAGSGSDVFGDCDADVLVTGELSHHAALKFAERGQIAVMLMHSSSERGFLRDRLAPRLLEMLVAADVDAKVLVSEHDAEIFHVWTG